MFINITFLFKDNLKTNQVVQCQQHSVVHLPVQHCQNLKH